MTICQLCRKQLFKVRNPGPSGAWYHRGNASAFCRPGDGSHRKAIPLTITPRQR